MNLVYSSDWKDKKQELIQEFNELLNSINSSASKERILWKQIYENAITDRNNANSCFMDVYPHLRDDMENHMQVGRQAVEYLTRMEKSNEQLLKLAGIIQKALENEQNEYIDQDALLMEIQAAQDEITQD